MVSDYGAFSRQQSLIGARQRGAVAAWPLAARTQQPAMNPDQSGTIRPVPISHRHSGVA
jgi:hypothetical protein